VSRRVGRTAAEVTAALTTSSPAYRQLTPTAAAGAREVQCASSGNNNRSASNACAHTEPPPRTPRHRRNVPRSTAADRRSALAPPGRGKRQERSVTICQLARRVRLPVQVPAGKSAAWHGNVRQPDAARSLRRHRPAAPTRRMPAPAAASRPIGQRRCVIRGVRAGQPGHRGQRHRFRRNSAPSAMRGNRLSGGADRSHPFVNATSSADRRHRIVPVARIDARSVVTRHPGLAPCCVPASR